MSLSALTSKTSLLVLLRWVLRLSRLRGFKGAVPRLGSCLMPPAPVVPGAGQAVHGFEGRAWLLGLG